MFDKKSYFLFSIIVILFAALMGLCCYRVYEVANKEENNFNENENNNQNIPQLPSDSGNNDDDNIDIESKYYTISFDTDGGSEVEDIRVKYGTKVKLPSTYKIDYTFSGWIFENKIVDDTYEVKNDMLLKANWKRNEEEQIKDDDKEIIEYNFDKIEEFNGDINSVNLLDIYNNNRNAIKAKYNDKNISIEILFNNSNRDYVKVNEIIIEDELKGHAFSVFKFNNSYIIMFSSPQAQCFDDNVIILNENGEIISKLGFKKSLSGISFSKEKNQIEIKTIDFCGATVGLYESLKETYQINEDRLLLIDTNHHNNKIYIYKLYSDYVYNTSHYELENYDLVYTYDCASNECKCFGVNGDNLLIFDNGYYLYNYKNDTKKLIASKELNGSLNYMLDKTTAIFETKNIIFHNEDENMYYIYDEIGDYITKLSNEPYRVGIGGNKYYFTDTFISDEKGSTIEIYDSNFNKLWIITGMGKNSEYVTNYNNTITFNAEKDGVYVLFDSDMNLIHESKKYEMIGIAKAYVVVVDENKLKVLDLNQNVVGEFDYLPNAYKFDNVYYNDTSSNLTISAYDYENDKYVYYYFNTLTKEISTKKD